MQEPKVYDIWWNDSSCKRSISMGIWDCQVLWFVDLVRPRKAEYQEDRKLLQELQEDDVEG